MLIIAQHVRLEDVSDGGVHCRDTRMEQSGNFSGGHPYIVTGYADHLALHDDNSSCHDFFLFQMVQPANSSMLFNLAARISMSWLSFSLVIFAYIYVVFMLLGPNVD